MKKTVSLLAFAALALPSALIAQNNTDSNSLAATSVNMAEFADFELVPEETVTYSNKEVFNWAEFEIELEESQINWTFHTDLANRILYIDFEALGGKITAMELLSPSGSILFADKQLQSLPTNTIYEVSLQKLEIGNYFVLLHTYDGYIRQEIRVTE